jgi:hypothetical protein
MKIEKYLQKILHYWGFNPGIKIKSKYWIQQAIKRPGRVRRVIKMWYGEKAFNPDGTIKMEYLNKAIERAKRINNLSLLRALYLAKTLKKL